MSQNKVKSKKDYFALIRQDELLVGDIKTQTGLDILDCLGDITDCVASVAAYATTKEGLDMRLRIHCGLWSLDSGCPDYDQDHRGEVGLGWLCLHGARSQKAKDERIREAVADMIRDLANNI